jgi:hypothetical protein
MLSILDDEYSQNGFKNDLTAPRTTMGYHLKGLDSSFQSLSSLELSDTKVDEP